MIKMIRISVQWKEIISNIREQNKDVKIIVMTPTKQAKVNDNGDVIRRDTDKNKKGYP